MSAASHFTQKADLLAKKILSSLALAGVVVFSMTACSGGTDEASSAGCGAAASGANSDKVEVSGEAGSKPTVEFPAPLRPSKTERTVITDGKGEVAVDGSSVTVDIFGYNGTSGDPIEELTSEGAAVTLGDQLIPGLVSAIKCSGAGARIAAVIPPKDAFGETGSEQIGLNGTDSLVLMIDVVEVAEKVEVLDRADGKDQPAPAGFATVTLADDGAPTITIPDAPAPTELQIAALKVGDGPEVKEGDTVTVHYTGVVWSTGEVFDSSWARGEPAPFPTTGVIPGFSKALVGQTVGSQVIAQIPPAEGYGEQVPPGAGFAPTDTLVFVLDILATQ